MNFEEVIDFKPRGDSHWGSVPEEWRQGRTAYGGVMAAAAVRALREQVSGERPLRQFNAQFVSMAGAGELQLSSTILAQGSNVTSGQVTVLSEQRPSLCLTAVFGAPRFTSKPVEADLAPAQQSPEQLPAFPYIEGVTPQFTRHIEYRMLNTPLPFSDHDQAGVEGFCRHRTLCGNAEEATIGLLDAWPPAVLPLLARPSPASTVSWSAHLYDPPQHRPGDWFYYKAEPVRFQDGYATIQARLHAADGRLIAWSEQLVAVFEKTLKAS